MSRLRAWFAAHWQTLLNVYLFVNLAGWLAWDLHGKWRGGQLNYIEVSFALQNCLWISMVLIRRQHLAVDRNVFNQLVAVVAFFSGLAMPATAPSGPPLAIGISSGLILASNVFGAITVLNLGRSFGILIAMREVRTGGLYRVVRHPMYATDLLLRAGYIVSHFGWLNLVIVVASGLCYVYRALQEEKFLAEWPEYREYMARVRYRFVPGIW